MESNTNNYESTYPKPPRRTVTRIIGAVYFWIAIFHMLMCLIIDMTLTILVRFLYKLISDKKKEYEGFVFPIMRFWQKTALHLNAIDYVVDKPVS